MNITGKKLTALLLAAALLLGLAACGGGKDEEEQLSATVFVPVYQALDNLGMDYVEQVCISGDCVYLLGLSETVTERSEVNPDTGEEEIYQDYEQNYILYRVPTDGGEPVKLEGYVPEVIQSYTEDEQVYSYIQDFSAGPDGTLYIEESVERYTFNLPEDFDPETDDRWEYQEYSNTVIRHQLDADGNEISRTERSGYSYDSEDPLAQQLGVEQIIGLYHDSKEHTYAVTETFIAVLDSDNQELFRVEGEDLWNSMYELADGSMAMLFNIWDEEEEKSVTSLKVVDLEAKAWGAEYPLPSDVYSIYPGGGEYLYYYRNGESVYGYKAGEETPQRLFSWLDADINRSDVVNFGFLSDGRVAAVTRTWTDDGYDMDLVLMTETPRSELPEKITLTFATLSLNYDMRGRIIDFNKSSTTHRIEVRDYSELAGDYEAGLTLMNTEMIAGKVADILDTSSLPVRQYGSRGMLEDLWTFIDNDPEISREDLMEAPLKAASMDGKLYYIFPSFNISTVMGSKAVVGDRMSWTLADMNQALASMPEGCTIFSQYDTKESMLSTILAQNMDGFVDWTTGECSFDTDGFKALLEFCNTFPAEIDWKQYEDNSYYYESDYARILNGKQMLASIGIYSLDWGISQYSAVFGGDYSYIGYPMEDGSVGSTFSIYEGLAISTACKDKEAAWGFIREDLLPQRSENSEGYYYYYNDLPINRADFDWMVEDAMYPYERDYSTGEPYLDENGDPIPRNLGSIYIDENTQLPLELFDQEDYDKLMALMDSITKISSYDQHIYDIVSEEAGGYFAGDTPLDSAATLIQSKVKLYVNEQR